MNATPATSPVMGTASTMGDVEQLTTTRLIRDAARTYRDQGIVHRTLAGEWKVTDYATSWGRTQRVAAGLAAQGIGPGDRVGLLLWNDLRHFECYFAVPLTGATMVQLNLRLAPQDLAYVIRHSGARTLIVDATLLPLAEGLAPHLPEDTRWIVASDGDLPEAWAGRADAVSYEDLVAGHEPIEDAPDMDERSASGACYTTGTTGRPKGVYYSHRSTWLHSFAVAASTGMTMDDTVMLLTPMFHAQCWGLPYAAVAVGARIVLPGRFTLQDTPLLTDALVEHGVTLAPAAPAILLPMLHHLEQMAQTPHLPGLRFLCGATEPPVALMQGFDRLMGAEIIHAYGATETSPIVSVNRLRPALKAGLAEDEQWDLKRYQGLVVTGVDVKIVDPLGQPLPPGEQNVGEIRVRGPWVTSSYGDDPEATEKGFDDEGYWRSGDVGYLSEDGYLKVSDRMKDVIKSGGEWISTIDLENHMLTVPGVSEAAVVGVPHPKWQERPLALAVRAPGADVTEEQVKDALRARFASWQVPDRVLFVDELDRTSVGKLDKKRLRQAYADALAEGDGPSAPQD